MIIRSIIKSDYQDIIGLLNQLSDVGSIRYDDFVIHLNILPQNHLVYVIEDNKKVIGTATMIIENKIIHNFGKVGHIEDVVIDKKHRRKQLGRKIIEHLIYVAKQRGCYKVILNCEDKNISFYKRLGFKVNSVEMANYFKSKL